MSRPNKSGLDYFPLDVDIFSDDKLKYIRARFDEKGELITIKLLCEIYRSGYYTEWNEDKSLIFSDTAGRNITANLANDVVHELVKRDFFDKGIFDRFFLLTSRGIQNRFVQAVTNRKGVEIIKDYWLIDLPENTKNTTFSISYITNEVNDVINRINDITNDINKTKLNNIKSNKTKTGSADKPQTSKKFIPPTVEEVKAYCLERGNIIDPKKFFDFFTESNWIDSKGNPVLNWKQKIITWEGRSPNGNGRENNSGNNGGMSGGNMDGVPKKVKSTEL